MRRWHYRFAASIMVLWWGGFVFLDALLIVKIDANDLFTMVSLAGSGVLFFFWLTAALLPKMALRHAVMLGGAALLGTCCTSLIQYVCLCANVRPFYGSLAIEYELTYLRAHEVACFWLVDIFGNLALLAIPLTLAVVLLPCFIAKEGDANPPLR